MEFIVKRFEQLTEKEVYEILKARAEIFMMEQNIMYLDMDDIDYKSLHCFFTEEGRVLAYLRAFHEEEGDEEVRIGRVLSIEHGKGHGKEFYMSRWYDKERNRVIRKNSRKPKKRVSSKEALFFGCI